MKSKGKRQCEVKAKAFVATIESHFLLQHKTIIESIVKVILILFSDFKYVLEWIEEKRLGKFYNITIERRESNRK
jgi:hypothetical protein